MNEFWVLKQVIAVVEKCRKISAILNFAFTPIEVDIKFQ
jgi:hypothetical protein